MSLTEKKHLSQNTHMLYLVIMKAKFAFLVITVKKKIHRMLNRTEGI